MTWVRKRSGDLERPIVAVYRCPVHGEFDAEVSRDATGGAPEVVQCSATCSMLASWTPTPVACRVRRVEVTRGKWEKPEQKTFLDTRKLGEGQDVEEFQAERKKVWTEHRHKEIRELLR